jgi:hypothetical protein
MTRLSVERLVELRAAAAEPGLPIDWRDLLAELDAVREERETNFALLKDAEAAHRDTLIQARLLVMTQERDALRDERPGLRRVVELARMYERALDREGSADEDTDDLRGKLLDALYALGDAVDAPLETETSLRAELTTVTRERDEAREALAVFQRAAVAEREARSLISARARRLVDGKNDDIACAETQREELAAALEHLREAAQPVVAAFESLDVPHAECVARNLALREALAVPTSEAATTARRGWEAKGIEEAAKVCDAYATEGDPGCRYRYRQNEAAEELAARLRALAAKRQGGGT